MRIAQREDLIAQEDTLIKRAEALLADYPKDVPYKPSQFGWGD